MKLAIWIVCGLLAALWTGGAFAAAALTEWASGLIASGAAVDMGRAVAEAGGAGMVLYNDPASTTTNLLAL